MNLAASLPDDELTLARLTAAKLAKVMHGLLSVGVASLEIETPRDFLEGREKTPLGFLEVLACVGVSTGHADQLPLLRQRVNELADTVNEFQRAFLELADWRAMPPEFLSAAVDHLGNSYALFCDQLSAFCSLLGMDSDFTRQAAEDRSYLVSFFETVSPQAPAAAK